MRGTSLIEGEQRIVVTSEIVQDELYNEKTPTVTLAELLDQYSAEEILKANGGTIPGTNEELERVANQLIKESQENGY